jgi:hypothetical protein
MFEAKTWNPSKKYLNLKQVKLFGVTKKKEIKARHLARFVFPSFFVNDKQKKHVSK